MSVFHEEDHPRDAEGKFTHASVGAWAKDAVQRLNRLYDGPQIAALRGEAPPGHAAAVRRAEHLWAIPSGGGQRTGAQHEELMRLEEAFAAYREQLDLRPDPNSRDERYVGDLGERFTRYGEPLGRVTDAPPVSAQRGYRRVGDHPQRVGTPEGGGGGFLHEVVSTHPEAGGLWIDPANPGTRHAPAYLNDYGFTAHEVIPERSRTDRHKTLRAVRRDSGRHGRSRGEMENAAEFLAWMKRGQARSRAEATREPVRRTPRGTQVDSWMSKVSSSIGQKGRT